MSRYVNADALIERWNNMSVRGRTEFDQEIMVAPSIDIVCCAKCGHHKEKYGTFKGEKIVYYRCMELGRDVEADDFCSYGERSSE